MGMRSSSNSKNGLLDLLNRLPEKSGGYTMVEVGSYAGESADIFCSTGKIKKCYCIDPWKDIPGHDGNSYLRMDSVERTFDSVAAKNPKISKFKGVLRDFVANVPEDVLSTIDFVYIDAMHTYECCKDDITVSESFFPNLIAIGGHDYTTTHSHTVGVVMAVDEAYGGPDATFCDTSWLHIFND